MPADAVYDVDHPKVKHPPTDRTATGCANTSLEMEPRTRQGEVAALSESVEQLYHLVMIKASTRKSRTYL